MLSQLARFAGVGGLATVLHVAVALFLREAAGAPELWANFAGFCAAVALSYAGHARVTFDVALRPALQLPQFVVVSGLGLATSTAIVWLVTEKLGGSFVLAMAFVALAVPGVTFLALRSWVFAEARRSHDVLGLALATAAGAATLLVFWGRAINHDTAWYLLATRKWLDGATLYRDIIEVNPPLNFYLTVPAVALADLLSIADADGQYIVLSLAICGALSACWPTLRDGLALDRGRAIAMMAALALAMVVPALGDAGQRDHLMVIFALPWILGEMAGSPARRQMPLAFVAALGFCLKPYFILIPVAVTLWRIVTERSVRPILSPSNLVLAGAGLAYGAFVAFVHPLYLGEIVPLANLVYGGGYGTSLGRLFAAGQTALILTAITVALASTQPGRGALFAWVAVATMLGYFWQAKGFGYHLVPVYAFAFVQCALIAVRIADQTTRLAAVAVMAALAAVGAGRGFYNDALATAVTAEARSTGSVGSMMTLTTQIDPGPAAAAKLGAAWVSRYPANWLVPGALEGLSKADCAAEPGVCARLNRALATTRSHNLDDIAAAQPDLIVFDRHPYFIDGEFDWVAFLRQDSRAEDILAPYEPVLSTGRFDYWRRAD